tara:strand:- start:2013 stop:2678 length:666 start_codon:yes stop_codon:yes gene_type:complete
MKTITINEKDIDVPTSWNNITFNKFNKFSVLINSQRTEEEFSKDYEELEEDIRSLEWSLENVRLNTKLACFWTGLTEEEVSLCNIDEVEGILSSMDFMNESYTPIAVDKFEFKGFEYFLPQPGMVKENFGTFIEAEQVEINNKKLKKGDLSVLPKQIAILCKREGEKRGLINDEIIDKRANSFKNLDMATIWDVAFFLTQQENKLMTLSLTYLLQTETPKL